MKKVLLLILLLQLAGQNILAQISTCPERFLAYNSKGQEVTSFCVGEKIRFKSCLTNSQPDKEYYDFDKADGLQISTDTTKAVVYTKPGIYIVTQVVNTAGGNNQGERTIIVLDTPPPDFEVISCARNLFNVIIKDNVYDNFDVDFGDGITRKLNQGASINHQYNQNRPYKITVTGSYTQATCAAKREVVVQPLPEPVAPTLESVSLLNSSSVGSISLTWSGAQPEYYYVVEKLNGNTFVPLDTVKNPASATVLHTLANIDARSSSCFRVRITDRCGTALAITTQNICTLPLSATAGDKNISLSWPPYPEQSQILQFNIIRNGQAYTNVPAGSSTYQDTSVVCGANYCYQVIAILRNNSQSVSNEVCESAASNQPPKPGYLSSTFTPQNTILLQFKAPGSETIKEVTYQKSLGNASFALLAVTNQDAHTDATGFSFSSPPCYQAFFKNSCELTSAISNKTCPSVLEAFLQDNGSARLTWSAYVGFPNGVNQYVLEKLNTSGIVTQSIPVSGNFYIDNQLPDSEQQLYYRIKVTSGNPVAESYSNTVTLNQELRILIPTAFTPNGDNLNDRFEVKGKFINSYRMVIYNRWGQIVFDNKNNSSGWDGRMNGKDAPIGAYPYNIKAKDINGKEIVKTGSVTLLK